MFVNGISGTVNSFNGINHLTRLISDFDTPIIVHDVK